MLVLILERVPAGLRGELTRWMLEPRAGVFVGQVSAMVRDKLWDKVESGLKGGSALLIHSTNNEQRFAIRVRGEPSRVVVDFEGLSLIKMQRNQ